MKPKIIIFEGCDKSGKSTLLSKFNELTDFKYWVLDRGFISSLVYDKLFSRNNEAYFIDILSNMKENFDIHIIYCYANKNIIEKRLSEANEQLPIELSNIKRVQELFVGFIEQYDLKNIKINTNESQENCLKKIFDFIGE